MMIFGNALLIQNLKGREHNIMNDDIVQFCTDCVSDVAQFRINGLEHHDDDDVADIYTDCVSDVAQYPMNREQHYFDVAKLCCD